MIYAEQNKVRTSMNISTPGNDRTPGTTEPGKDRAREGPSPGKAEPGNDRAREYRARDSRSGLGLGACLIIVCPKYSIIIF
jgi:hypothetical protein